MTDKEKEQICRWWVNHELRSNRVTFSDKVYVSTADIQDFEQFIDSLQEESKPKFKVGQTITDPTDSTFTFHINKIEDGRYIEKEDEWVLVKEADANYELVEDPISEDLDEEDSFDELLQKLYIKYNKEVSLEKLLDIASNFVKWQKVQLIKSAELDGWIARDEDDRLHLFEVEPRRLEKEHRWWDRDYHRTGLDESDFPDLKWEDEPVYVKLPIIVED